MAFGVFLWHSPTLPGQIGCGLSIVGVLVNMARVWARRAPTSLPTDGEHVTLAHAYMRELARQRERWLSTRAWQYLCIAPGLVVLTVGREVTHSGQSPVPLVIFMALVLGIAQVLNNRLAHGLERKIARVKAAATAPQ